jgi:Gpi18-like mannosyltransferase
VPGALAAWCGRVLPYVGVVAAALALRLTLVPMESGDLNGFVRPWWDEIKTHGHFAALKGGFSNYAPGYLYLLALVSYLPVKALWGIKAISVAFDGVLAVAFFNVVAPRVSTRPGRLLALALPLFAPSVVLNGAAWAQCDVIHTAFVLLALGAALKDHGHRAALLTGVALSFKLQAIFFLPALVLILAKAKSKGGKARFSWAAPLWVPLVFVASLVPAWVAGRPAVDLLLIYVRQAGSYRDLSLWAPNIYHLIPGAPEGPFRNAGLVLTASALAAAAYLASQSREQWRHRERILIAVGTCVLCPFLLPAMHERYFFTADVLSLLLPFWMPRRWWVPLAIGAASTLSYGNFLFGQHPIELKYLALLMAAALAAVARDWVRALALRW